jgi:hypothetical protein
MTLQRSKVISGTQLSLQALSEWPTQCDRLSGMHFLPNAVQTAGSKAARAMWIGSANAVGHHDDVQRILGRMPVPQFPE